MTPRLSPGVEAGAMVREAQARGGFAAVLRRGDPDAGAILVLLRERGRVAALLERVLAPDGSYGWRASPRLEPGNESSASSLLSDRQRFDPDLWVIELDVADAERFAAEWTASR